MRIYHYAGCGTCKAARRFLKQRGVQAVEIDLVASPPSPEAMADLHARSGLPLRRFFNVSGQSYRAGGWAARLGTTPETELLEALAADGKLIKRPVLDLGDRVLVGFDEAAWAEALP